MDKVLLYGKAGYANSNVDLKANSGSPVSGISAHTSSREDGWVIEGRIEYRAMCSLIFGIDYNYVSLGGAVASRRQRAVRRRACPLASTWTTFTFTL